MEEPVTLRRVIKKIPWLFVAILLLWLVIRESAETRMYIYTPFLFVMAFLISYLLMPFMILLGHKTGILDLPDSNRKVHTHAIPRTGGIAIYLSFSATMILCGHFSVEMKSILVGGGVVFIVGVIDDYRGLSSLVRIIVQLSAAIFLIASGVHVTFVPDWLGGIVTESLITLIWIIGITNAMNFIDGMDGLAGGMSVIFSTFFAIISYFTNQYYFMYLALALAGASLGFLPYNFPRNKPARIFLGDAGSTFIGFTLASSAILGEWGNSIVDIAVPVIILSVLIFDMALTTIVRIAKGEVRSFRDWLAFTGRDHVHHRIGMLGFGKQKTVYLYYYIAIGLGLTSLIIVRSTWEISLIAILQSFILLFVLGIILVKTTDTV
jgi:UDP-GlcNAc:undecaprenyl-phosphate/decaprenyl-phosphate GlcNAc-1-phosphate transferase